MYSRDSFLLILLVLILIHTTAVSSKSVYYVRSDDDPLQNCSLSTCNLDYYLLNASKYFASNTELKFLSGVHQLDTIITIRDVHHFSLTGNLRNNIVDSIVKCSSYSAGGIVIINSSYVNMKDLILKDCNIASYYPIYSMPGGLSWSSASLLIKNSHSLTLCQVITLLDSYSIVLINVLNSNLNNVSLNGIVVIYNSAMDNHVTMKNKNKLYLHFYNSSTYLHNSSYRSYGMTLNFVQYSSGVQVLISSVHFQTEKAIVVFSYTCCNGSNEVIFSNCSFDHIKCTSKSDEHVITIFVDNNQCNFSDKPINFITFRNCYFANIVNHIESMTKHIMWFSSTNNESLLYITNSQFYNNNGIVILVTPGKSSVHHSSVIIKNVTFSQLVDIDAVMVLYSAHMKLEGPVIFSQMYNINTAVIYGNKLQLVLSGYIDFSDIDTYYVIVNECVYLTPNTHIYLTSNFIREEIFINEDIHDINVYFRPCMLQYISNSLQDYHQDLVNIKYYNISIIINTTLFNVLCANKYCTTHCSWLGNGLFEAFSPLAVNRQNIKFTNDNQEDSNKIVSNRKRVCYCTDNYLYNCYVDEINSVYPGQTVHLHLISTVKDVMYVTLSVKTTIEMSCWVTKGSEIEQRIYNNCTLVYFTIRQYKKWCELFLSYSPFGADIFYVNLQPCPLGFILNQLEGYCECDPVLTSTTVVSITHCDINDQTILRPGNSWIHATSNFTYQMSSHCPFHYCLPYSSSFHLSHPDSQCQFNRTGLLCGKCQKGLSTVFGTSNCKQLCSNIFLLTTIAIALAGIALLLALFMLNLTVTDGTVNAFILYVNIVSINSHIIFTHQSTALAHVFISLANLDLGFEMCFYDGMDDYVKMWLQLTFPFYLISIATLLIIASRYSTKIQRLTARRVLPVLATLFLLSYTKILRIVSNVLFFYSTITDIPSNKTAVVWSVDANVPLFGAKFTILFIACLILLIIIIPFNVVLTFTRTLSRHRLINYFKPLLDAYQGPYRNQYYFWPGLQLVIRAVFFGLSSLDKNINLPIGLVLLAAMLGIHGYVRPFKSSFKNIQELIFIFNLIVMFVFIQFENRNSITVNTSVAIASIHFTVIFLNNLRLYQCLSLLQYISRKNKSVVSLKQFIISKWMHYTKRNQSHNDNVRNMPLRNVIPEVTYNYKEYREPLLGQD